MTYYTANLLASTRNSSQRVKILSKGCTCTQNPWRQYNLWYWRATSSSKNITRSLPDHSNKATLNGTKSSQQLSCCQVHNRYSWSLAARLCPHWEYHRNVSFGVADWTIQLYSSKCLQCRRETEAAQYWNTLRCVLLSYSLYCPLQKVVFFHKVFSYCLKAQSVAIHTNPFSTIFS